MLFWEGAVLNQYCTQEPKFFLPPNWYPSKFSASNIDPYLNPVALQSSLKYTCIHWIMYSVYIVTLSCKEFSINILCQRKLRAHHNRSYRDIAIVKGAVTLIPRFLSDMFSFPISSSIAITPSNTSFIQNIPIHIWSNHWISNRMKIQMFSSKMGANFSLFGKSVFLQYFALYCTRTWSKL